VICCNFTPVVRQGRLVGVPQAGTYREIYNSDSEYYGGGNVGVPLGAAKAERREAQGRPYSISINMPPLGVAVYKPVV